MIIDCQSCPVRGTHCAECMVPVVAQQWLAGPGLGPPVPRGRHRAPSGRQLPRGGTAGAHDREGELDDAEWEAVDVFVRAGMVNTLVAAGSTARVAAEGVWSRVG